MGWEYFTFGLARVLCGEDLQYVEQLINTKYTKDLLKYLQATSMYVYGFFNVVITSLAQVFTHTKSYIFINGLLHPLSSTVHPDCLLEKMSLVNAP